MREPNLSQPGETDQPWQMVNFFTNRVSGDRFFYRENALGSNLATVGMTGNAVSRTEFDAYGMELSILAGTNTSHRFAGRHGYYKDDSSGMSLLGQRFYHAKIGKFLTQDPIGHSGGLNLYAYCGNGPLVSVDPDGTRPISDRDKVIMHKLYTWYQGKDSAERGSSMQQINRAVANIKAEILMVPDNQDDPAHLKATLWAIEQLGSTKYKMVSGAYKCNFFVSDSYSVRGGLGLQNMGGTFPSRKGIFSGKVGPLSAKSLFSCESYQGLANVHVYEEGFCMMRRIGDICSFEGRNGGFHTTLWLAPGLYINAGEKEVRLADTARIRAGHKPYESVRRWK